MSQVTPSLIAEFESRLARGEHINSTRGEESQLVFAWKDREQQAERIKELEALVVMGFWEEEQPQFTQGYNCHEMIEPLTAEQANGFVKHIKQQAERIKELETELAWPFIRSKVAELEADCKHVRQANENYRNENAIAVKERDELALQNKGLRKHLSTVFKKYEDGTPCYDEPEYGTFIGYAIYIQDDDFKAIADLLNAHAAIDAERKEGV